MLDLRMISLLYVLALVCRSCLADPLTCYYLDGSIAESDIACNANAVNGTDNASACCRGYADAYCTVNGLCNYRGVLTRASCTDRTWKSLKCPRQCTTGNTNTFMNLYPCIGAGSFICEWDNCSDNNFTLYPSDLAIVLRDSQAPDGLDAVAFANPSNPFAGSNDTTSTTTLAVGGSSRASETAAPPKATASSGTQTSPSQSASATSETQTSSSQSASATTAATADGSKSSSSNLTLPLGLAIPLGILLLAAVAAVFYYRRRATKSSSPRQQSSHRKRRELLSSDGPNTPKPKSAWQSGGQQYSSGSGALAGPATSEMPDRGPLPELKGPGIAAHELSSSGRHSMPMRKY